MQSKNQLLKNVSKLLFLVCWLLCLQPMDLLAQCNLACNNLVSVALDNSCTGEVTIGMILEAEEDPDLCQPNAPENFTVSVSETKEGPPIASSPMVTSDHIGEEFFVTILHVPSNNFCTGRIRVIDDSPPLLTCPADVQVDCGMSTDTSATGIATAIDCWDFEISFSDTYVNQDMMCTSLIGTITRQWRALAINGRSSTCTQTIEINRLSIDDVDFPPNRNGVDAPTLSCDSFGLDPLATGAPSLNGTPIDIMNGLCGITASFRDREIDDCGSSFTVIRSWTVVDACASRVERRDQIILVSDNDGPTVTCRDTIRSGTTSLTECTADVIMPAATISDNCSSSFTAVMQTPAGVVNGNGGTIPNLPEGFTSVVYRITDDCGQLGTCTTVVEVIDRSRPSMVCEDELTVALNDAGFGTAGVNSMVLSTDDNCCSRVTVEVRRMEDDDDAYDDEVVLSCSDVGTVVMALNRAVDCNGNENFCMVRLIAVDNNGATLTCPDNMTINCTDSPDDLTLTGTPSIMGICSNPNSQATFVDQDDLSACGTGSILRTWSTTVMGGGTTSCQQTITIVDPTPVVVNFPPDLNLDQCADPDDLDPDDLDAPFNGPTVSGAGDCNDLDIDFEDLPLISEGGNCAVIRRVWTVIDICNFDDQNPENGGIFRDTQRIIINDTQDPVLLCPNTQTVSTGTNCMSNVLLDPVSVSGECFPEDLIINPSGELGLGNFFSNVVPGTYTMIYEVIDNCNNSSQCSFEVVVVDDVSPIADCVPQLTVNIETGGTVLVSGSAFNMNSSDNCTTQQDLDFRVGPVPPPGTTTPPSGAPLGFICDDVGTVATLAMWVGDENGNFSFCETTIQVADGNGNCTNGANGMIAGFIEAPSGEMINEVSVSLENSGMPNSRTNESGQFAFEGVAMRATYRVLAERNTSFKEGLSTFDIVKLIQHLTGRQLLEDPYAQIAADVNGDNRISVFDALILQKLILNLQLEVESNQSWRFIPKGFHFPEPKNVFAHPFPEFMDIVNLEKDYMNADFVAVKVGDVNMSYQTSAAAKNIESRSNQSLVFEVEDQVLSPGEYWVDLKVPSPTPTGIQVAFYVKPDKATLVEVQSPILGNGLMAHMEQDGHVLLSGIQLGANTPNRFEETFLRFRIQVQETGTVSEMLHLAPERLNVEAIYQDGRVLQDAKIQRSFAEELDLIAQPNPFRENVQIWIDSDTPGQLEASIWSANGQLIHQQQIRKGSGKYLFQLDERILVDKGIYYLRVKGTQGSKIIKLIRQ